MTQYTSLFLYAVFMQVQHYKQPKKWVLQGVYNSETTAREICKEEKITSFEIVRYTQG